MTDERRQEQEKTEPVVAEGEGRKAAEEEALVQMKRAETLKTENNALAEKIHELELSG